MLMQTQTLQIAGKRLVVLEEQEFERLCEQAGRRADVSDLPALPKPDKHGRVPAIEYSRISIARNVIRARKSCGLSQRELAVMAGIRQETLSRIETGKFTPRVSTIDSIDRALKKAQSRRPR